MTDPELFVVRIWRQLAGGFRASVRRVDDEEVRHFSQPDEVTRFLVAAAEPEAGTEPSVGVPADKVTDAAGSAGRRR